MTRKKKGVRRLIVTDLQSSETWPDLTYHSFEYAYQIDQRTGQPYVNVKINHPDTDGNPGENQAKYFQGVVIGKVYQVKIFIGGKIVFDVPWAVAVLPWELVFFHDYMEGNNELLVQPAEQQISWRKLRDKYGT